MANSTSTIVCPYLIPLLIHFSFTILYTCSITTQTLSDKIITKTTTNDKPHSFYYAQIQCKQNILTLNKEALKISQMSLLQLHFTSQALRPSYHNFRRKNAPLYASKRVTFVRTKIRAVSTVPERDSDSDLDLDINDPNKPPYVGFVFVSVSSTIIMLHSFYTFIF